MPSVSTVVVVVVALCLGHAGGAVTTLRTPVIRPAPHTQIKWLINTGKIADRWPSTCAQAKANDSRPPRCEPSAAVASPNSITRLQMIHGGNTAVLVMPTIDGSHRCLRDGVTSQFSLGSVRLDHGRNNLFPVIQPFPDWRAFVDDSPNRESDELAAAVPDDGQPAAVDPSGLQPNSSATDRLKTAPQDERVSAPEDKLADGRRNPRKIINAVDAFLDDRGRILWVLDTGGAGQDACYGNKSPDEKETSDDVVENPKFLAIDVHTNKIINVVSLSRVWKPKMSCFQYIVAIYPDTEITHKGHSGVNETTGKDTNSTDTTSCVDWPLVVVGDAGTNHLLVYSHSQDKFTEIMLPLEKKHVFYDEYVGDDSNTKGDADSESKQTTRPRKKWPKSPVHDILYMVPLYPHVNHSKLLITYHGCQDMYHLRLQPSNLDFSYFANVTDDNNSDGMPKPLSPVTGTLTVLGKKPCKMILLGTDRRRTDIRGADDEDFVGGGTTVYFRLENTNDLWSWNTAKSKQIVGAGVFIDERDFQLVRMGQTCRIPVAISAGPVVAASQSDDDDNDDDKRSSTTPETPQVVQQLIWMLETNFIDHFRGIVDRMGSNAKLQPIEEPLYDISDCDTTASNSEDTKERPSPSRVQPTIDNRINSNFCPYSKY